MPDQLEDTQDLSGTQPITPPKNLPPTHVQPPAPRSERRPRKHKSKEHSALYLPAWSVGLMLLLVFGITAAIVMLVITLGGQSAPGGEPRIVIITAVPTNTPQFIDTPVPTSAATSQPIQNFQVTPPEFVLEGPTLPPIIHTATPVSINIGVTVIANTDELRVRPEPSLDNEQLFFAQEGDRFTVIDGPQQGSGLTWWLVQDPDDPDNRTGWAAADYLDVAIQ